MARTPQWCGPKGPHPRIRIIRKPRYPLRR
jgi:hypothetical protein